MTPDPRLQQIIYDPERRAVIRLEAQAIRRKDLEIPASVITVDDLDEWLAARIRERGERFRREAGGHPDDA